MHSVHNKFQIQKNYFHDALGCIHCLFLNAILKTDVIMCISLSSINRREFKSTLSLHKYTHLLWNYGILTNGNGNFRWTLWMFSFKSVCGISAMLDLPNYVRSAQNNWKCCSCKIKATTVQTWSDKPTKLTDRNCCKNQLSTHYRVPDCFLKHNDHELCHKSFLGFHGRTAAHKHKITVCGVKR